MNPRIASLVQKSFAECDSSPMSRFSDWLVVRQKGLICLTARSAEVIFVGSFLVVDSFLSLSEIRVWCNFFTWNSDSGCFPVILLGAFH